MRGGFANRSSTSSTTRSPTPIAAAKFALTAGGDEEQAVIEVRDNGLGIAADELAAGLRPFRRVDQDGFRGEAALGLGLPLTRQFIEAHGGTVELESTEGAGTRVTLTIPRGSR